MQRVAYPGSPEDRPIHFPMTALLQFYREEGLAQDHMPCQGETQVGRHNVPFSVSRSFHGVLKGKGLGVESWVFFVLYEFSL